MGGSLALERFAPTNGEFALFMGGGNVLEIRGLIGAGVGAGKLGLDHLIAVISPGFTDSICLKSE